jgi:uncharacterized protein
LVFSHKKNGIPLKSKIKEKRIFGCCNPLQKIDLPKTRDICNFVKNYAMQRLLTDNMDKINTLCKNYNVKSLFAFGSVVTDRFNDKSDIDLLVSFNPMDHGEYADTYFELAEKFEKLFKRQVDLVTDKSLKNPYFIDSVNQTKTLLYEC